MWTDPVLPMVAVALGDGSTIRATADHPFYVDAGGRRAEAGWVPAGQLLPGDRLRRVGGADATVAGVPRDAGRAVVYTLTVANDHTFFVGTAGVLVHNSGPCPDVFPSSPEEMNQLMGFQGISVPDGPGTPGRSKIVWQPSANVKITYEQHPYHLTAPDWHRGPHYHVDTPGHPHERYVPGDPLP